MKHNAEFMWKIVHVQKMYLFTVLLKGLFTHMTIKACFVSSSSSTYADNFAFIHPAFQRGLQKNSF